jgi:hypothetical protein
MSNAKGDSHMSPQDRLRHHVTGAIERGEAKPIRGIEQSDVDAAIRGLNMAGKPPSELDEIAAGHEVMHMFIFIFRGPLTISRSLR